MGKCMPNISKHVEVCIRGKAFVLFRKYLSTASRLIDVTRSDSLCSNNGPPEQYKGDKQDAGLLCYLHHATSYD